MASLENETSTVSHSALMFLSLELSSEWRDFGRRLGIPDAKLHQTKEDHVNHIPEAVYEMLRCWIAIKGREATSDALIKALTQAGRRDLAEQVQNREGLDIKIRLRELEATVRKLKEDGKKAVLEKEQTQRELEKTKEHFEFEREKLLQDLGQTKAMLEKVKRVNEESTQQINTLQDDLQTTKQLLKETKTISAEETETMNTKLVEMEKLLLQTKDEKISLKGELAKCQLEYAKECMGLKQLLANQQSSVTQKEVNDFEATKENFSGGKEDSHLAVDYGRLLVEVGEDITLDNSLKLAQLFCLPASKIDLLRTISNSETSGLRLLQMLTTRGIINKYDTDNLLKSCTLLKLEKINRDFIVPYQRKIDPKLHESHKVKEFFAWEDVNRVMNTDGNLTEVPSETLQEREERFVDINRTVKREVDEFVSTNRSSSIGWGMYGLYKEGRIGREGGTLNVAGITLSIPKGALPEDNILALGVMGNPTMPSSWENDGTRITPVVHLEPSGLVCEMRMQLTLPHSALPVTGNEPYNLVIHAGKENSDQRALSNEIVWREEACLDFQIAEKMISIDTDSFGYFFITLESQRVLPVHVVRLLVFVESIPNINDDVLITVALCSDCQPVYEMLLSRNRSQLLLETNSVMDVRLGEKGSQDSIRLDVALSSLDDSYVSVTQQTSMNLSINQLMSPTGINYQFKLEKNKNEDSKEVTFKILVSQAGKVCTDIILNAKVKDLLVSRQSHNHLMNMTDLDVKGYESFKNELACRLSEQDASMLASYFGLSSAEKSSLYKSDNSGWLLLKILSDKEFIQPNRLITLFEGLKDIYDTENSQLVLNYIEEISRQSQDGDVKPSARKARNLSSVPQLRRVSDFVLSQTWNLKNRIQSVFIRAGHSTTSTETPTEMKSA